MIYIADSSIITARHPEILDTGSLGLNRNPVTDDGQQIPARPRSTQADGIIISPTCVVQESQSPDAMLHEVLTYIGKDLTIKFLHQQIIFFID
jgi:hypothetical protein